jgi:hypothetical protein
MPRLFIALLILVAAGLVRLPVEHAITQRQAAAGFKRVNLTLDLRTQVSQAGFIAALGGYRSLVANMLWLEAHTAWEKTQWDRMYLLFNTVTALQPNAVVFWESRTTRTRPCSMKSWACCCGTSSRTIAPPPGPSPKAPPSPTPCRT